MAETALTDRHGRLHAKVDSYSKGVRIVTEMARRASPRLMKKLIDMAETHPDANIRLHAIDMIFNRAFGKAKQQVEIAADIKHSFVLRAPEMLDAGQWEAKFGARTIEATPEPVTIEDGSQSAEDGR